MDFEWTYITDTHQTIRKLREGADWMSVQLAIARIFIQLAVLHSRFMLDCRSGKISGKHSIGYIRTIFVTRVRRDL